MKKLGELLDPSVPNPAVTGVEYEYDCGDKRSYGHLNVTLQVEGLGELKFKGLVGSGGGYEAGNGETCFVNDEQVEFNYCPEVEVPHYYAGGRTCNRWEQRATETLTEDFALWLAGELEEFVQS